MVGSGSQFAIDQRLSRYAGATGFTLIIYEAFLTLPLEVTYAWNWKKNFNLVSVLYLVNKYIMTVFGLVIFITSGLYEIKWTYKRCSTMMVINVVNHAVITLCASWILALRAIAVLDNRGYIKHLIYGFMLITHITSIVLSCMYLVPSYTNTESLINTRLCTADPFISSTPRLLYVYTPEVIFISLVAGITLWKMISVRWRFGSASSIIFNLIRDGILTLLGVSGIRLNNCIRFLARPPSLVDLVVMDVLGTILVGRFVLSLRETADQTTTKDPFTTNLAGSHFQLSRDPRSEENYGGEILLEAEDPRLGWPSTRLTTFRRHPEDEYR